MNILSPSILAADFSKLGEEISEAKEAGARYLHIDVMDGVFVPSISFGMPVISSLRKITDLVFDVHLMIVEPERYLEYFAQCGADLITVHLETLKEPQSVLDKIHKLGLKAGISVNPETDVELLFPYLKYADMVLVMTVHPGFGGQKYIEDCTDKVKKLKKEIEIQNLHTDIEVDGGIGEDNIDVVLQAGANVVVAGSSVFTDNTYESAKQLIDRMNP